MYCSGINRSISNNFFMMILKSPDGTAHLICDRAHPEKAFFLLVAGVSIAALAQFKR